MISTLGAEVAPLKAPYPYFGGKSRAASLIWERFGNPQNYIEPFAGSLAVLLSRPHPAQIETVNDIDGFICNAWRAIAADPDNVAFHADNPVFECDLHARHAHLVGVRGELTARLEGDPHFFDAKLAGWWIWGACTNIGGHWCNGDGSWGVRDGLLVKLDKGEMGGIYRKIPHLGDAGTGVNKQGIRRKLPHVGDAGKGVNSQAAQGMEHGVHGWMRELSQRLRRVRVACGDWARVTTPSVTTKHGLTAVLLDPPYSDVGNDTNVYGVADAHGLTDSVRAWALENGRDPLLRIALCGYDGEHNQLEQHGWSVSTWHAKKGYQSSVTNSRKERIWFSPNCLTPETSLFDWEALR